MRSVSGNESDAVTLHLQQIGDAVGIVLPNDVLARMNLRAGDTLRLTERSNGSLILSSVDPDDARTMQIADQVMDEHRDTLVALAK